MVSFLVPAVLALAVSAASQAGTTSDKRPTVDPANVLNSRTGAEGRDAVCYKMRTYIFERNDDAAPKLVRETTCPPVRPHLNKSHARARMIPAK